MYTHVYNISIYVELYMALQTEKKLQQSDVQLSEILASLVDIRWVQLKGPQKPPEHHNTIFGIDGLKTGPQLGPDHGE